MELDRRWLWLAGALWLSACGDEPGGEASADPDRSRDGGARDATVRGTPPGNEGTEPEGELKPDAGERDSDTDPDDAPPVPRERLHDRRVFTVDPSSLPFFALPGAAVETDRWAGELGGAGYRVEVPVDWNGELVMYAHDYQGVGAPLSVRTPSLRRHLIEHGFAWAASSYSRNFYDVRAGVEDTNALALAFTRIAAENGRPLPPPSKLYVVGHAMGGHVAGAALERETEQTARNKIHYDGALALCGAMGDLELFRYFAAYQAVAQHLAELPLTRWPAPDFEALRVPLVNALFSAFPAVPTPSGEQLRAIVMNLTGGPRPIFEQGFVSSEQTTVWRSFNGEGWLFGVLSDPGIDTRGVVYALDADPAVNAEEAALNATVYRIRVGKDDDINPRQPNGLRWVPPIRGDLVAPVLSLHTLGDALFPFSMQQVYRRRAIQKGASGLLVQRAIRSPGHCDFTLAEETTAFDELVTWVRHRVKPGGDEVLDPAVVGAADYGCKFTDDRIGRDDPPILRTIRAELPACPR